MIGRWEAKRGQMVKALVVEHNLKRYLVIGVPLRFDLHNIMILFRWRACVRIRF